MEDINSTAAEKRKQFNPVFAVGGLILLGVIIFLIILNTGKKSQPEVEAVNNTNTSEFTVNGSSFVFDPATITVKKGDTVKITFVDNDGRHDLVVDGYNISTNILGGGGSDTIQFVADKTGSFEYYCSVANHRDLGMKGVLIVQ